MIDKEKLEEVKRFYQTANADQRYVIERLFPELAESEDERISREITEFIVNFHNGNYEKPYDYTIGTWLAWLDKQAGKDKHIQEVLSKHLEKQGEQKLVDNVEPKFKVGDTMRTLQEANNGYTDGMPVVVSIDNEYYHCTNELIAIKDQDDYEFPPINVKQKSADKVKPKFHEGDWVVCEVTGSVYQIKNCIENLNNHRCGYDLINGGYIGSDEVNHYHLWTIADAKDGDVLVVNGKPFICCYTDEYKGNYCCIDDKGCFRKNINFAFEGNCILPATEEQRDLLFQKMKEAGYEWDAEKKELRKIEEEYDGEDYGIDGLFHAQRILEKTLGEVDGYQTDDGILSHKCAITAVKKLYEQKSAEWSNDDEQYLLVCKNALRKYQVSDKWDADIISKWLENKLKQVQKPTDKIKPKFHEGDWIVDNNDGEVFQIIKIRDNTYRIICDDGEEFDAPHYQIENDYHFWTIQDAKPGDVLASKDNLSILIFRNLDTSITFSSYYNIEGKGELCWSNNCFIPATKEQRDTLIKAMTNAGYTFDFEKKKLKKIEQKPIKWSEEDEHRLKDTIYFLDTAKKHYASTVELDACINWLKALKQRIGE